jgi:hypothetical protein
MFVESGLGENRSQIEAVTVLVGKGFNEREIARVISAVRGERHL